MKEEFLKHLSKKKLCTDKDKILLAVSGGIDSMVMLHLFQECKFDISVAHCNFQLRGSESGGDELFVREFCTHHSIPFFTKRFDTSEYATTNSLSTQMAARELRYAWFGQLMADNHFDCLATAHHLNDSVETVLMSFVRGSSTEGLDGIAVKNGKIVRPLLFATRDQISSYAQENKISWREDSSNASNDYQRNFIRNRVVPLLKELNPSLENSFQDSMEKMAGANEFISLGISRWREKFEQRNSDQILFSKSGLDHFPNQVGILWNLVKEFGFNLDQCRQIVNGLHGQSGKHFLSHDYELTIDREHLVISKKENTPVEVRIAKGLSEVRLGDRTLTIEQTENLEISKDLSVANLDASKITFPLVWRTWKPGDAFHPLGMDHKKKLSDFLIDQKISVADKERITVLESGGEIVWVVGHRVDDRFKISTGSTKKTLRISLTSVQ
ncbi:MAG TPA: tRNA lysidine(34) synthetase TilS [Cyclobacteriaceae bacterium]|jgi:tRNA(Ile)-lysidine synthase|nr:tRNA lysidine(34) synthetase TilS [Cyclobacteriaceae bacterium]